MLKNQDFCLNRCAGGGIPLADFFKLASELGIHHIELRTDVHLGSNFLDDLSPAEVLALEKQYDVYVANIGAIFNFDRQDHFVEKLDEVKQVIDIAQQIGSRNIFFTPTRDPHDPRSQEQKMIDCIKNLRIFANLLAPTGIQGMIEPMGFTDAALRKPWLAQEVLDQADAKNFKLVADTFHYYGAQVSKQDFEDKIQVGRIGIVHLSSITAPKSPSQASDNDRYYLADNQHDVMHSLDKVSWLKHSSYSGLYSFEPCASAINNWSYDRVKANIKDSMAKVISA
jgi:2-keto-myo-inositol isomerase